MRIRSLLVLVAALAAALPAPGAEEWGFDPRFRPHPATDVLVKGEPPLLRRDEDAFVDLVEAAFDLAMPQAVERRLRVAVEEGFEKGDADARKRFLERVAPIGNLRRLVREQNLLEAEEGMMAFRRSLDTRLQEDPPDAVATLLRDLLRGRHETAWAGEPPIHAAAVESWLALTAFLTAVARNEAVAPSPGKDAVTRRELGLDLAKRDADERGLVLRAHRPWIRLQEAWDDGGDLRRLKLRIQVVQFVVDLLPEEKRVEVGEIEDLKGYARSAAVLRDVVPALDLWTTLGAHPEKVLALVEAWLGPVPEGEDALLLYRD